MNDRCPGHRSLGNGVLRGYRWIISRSGYASVVVSPADEVHGVVYELSPADEAGLDRHEGVDRGCYRKDYLPVELGGMTMECLVYVDPVQEEGLPSEEYILRINQGIRDSGIPESYVDRYIRPFVPSSGKIHRQFIFP
jgi:gamma-glutamylcyclotransferase (GGCT)/AIG2-like uncharacterized protein YtfP